MIRSSFILTSVLALAGLCLATSVEKKPAAKAVVPLDSKPRVKVEFSAETSRFGIACTKLEGPRQRPKLLTRDERGNTNHTCIWVDGFEYLFGLPYRNFQAPGILRYVKIDGVTQKNIAVKGSSNRKWISIMDLDKVGLRITQTVEIVVGEQTRLYDTVLVKYQVKNRDTRKHTVGLRMILDTFIGLTDGVPFYIPATETTKSSWVTTKRIFVQKDIPDHVQAVENSSRDAVVAELGLKLAGSEPLDKLVLCRWPDHDEVRWDWEYTAMNDPPKRDKDSCAALFWPKMQMNPGDVRTMAFTYGLGRIPDAHSKDYVAGGKLRLMSSPRIRAGQPFVVSAYIKGERGDVTIALPDGLELYKDQKTHKVPAPPEAGAYSEVAWKVVAKKEGTYTIKASHQSIGTAEVMIGVLGKESGGSK